jgi:hypothetical protein
MMMLTLGLGLDFDFSLTFYFYWIDRACVCYVDTVCEGNGYFVYLPINNNLLLI